MRKEIMKDILDWMRISRDHAILKDDEAMAKKLSDLILLIGISYDEVSICRLMENALEEIEEADYLRREAGKIRPLLFRLELN